MKNKRDFEFDNYNDSNRKGHHDYNSIDQENVNKEESQSFEKELRRAFIMKVFAILTVQLLITGIFCVISASVPEIARFQLKNKAVFYIVAIIAFIISICLFCFIETAKKVPLNYILCFIFTGCEAYLVSYLCLKTDFKTVIMALSMTCGLVICLILYACVTKTDFTGYGHYLFIASMIMLLCGIFLCFTQNKVAHIIFSGIGVLLFSIYLIFDVQLITGNHSHKLDYDDYIIGSMILYIDIISIFEHIRNILQ